MVSVGVRAPRGLGAAGRVPQKDRGSTAHPQRTCTDALLQADPGWLQSYFGCRKRRNSVSAGWAALWLQDQLSLAAGEQTCSTMHGHSLNPGKPLKKAAGKSFQKTSFAQTLGT